MQKKNTAETQGMTEEVQTAAKLFYENIFSARHAPTTNVVDGHTIQTKGD